MEKNIIEEVFGLAEQGLQKLNKKSREDHLKKILHSGFKFSKVYCAKSDVTLVKGHKAEVTEIAGGAILENKDGDIRLDLSYETILSNIKQDNLDEVAKALFN
jgi:vacuolar-type H+-ATPase subunit E/Vma4